MYCPTAELIAGFFTKPLQEAQFYKFRNAILGIKSENFELTTFGVVIVIKLVLPRSRS